MQSRVLRWGILSTARIGSQVWDAIRLSGNGTVAGVASRDAAKARVFVDALQASSPLRIAPRVYGSYEALLADPDIDAVYIPLPTGLRRPWVEAAAAAGKHVACEKPCAGSLEDLGAMLAACQLHGVQFMDGIMFMHGARLARMREVLDRGDEVGELRRVTSAFSFHGDARFLAQDIRTDPALEPFGCLGDLGWYCLRFSLWAAKWQLPRSVRGRILRSYQRPGNSQSVPLSFSGELIYDGWSAAFHCSFESALQQWARVEGTRGSIQLEDFVIPSAGAEARFRANGREISADQAGDPAPNGQATNLYRTFANLALSGRPDPFWPEISWKTQSVMEACLRSALDQGTS